MSEPLLSVCLITYNHSKYIKEAIDGVLMQNVNFTWELIIADDFSTDGTREIVLDYKKKYPDFIKLILQEKNVGAAKNWMDLITNPKSKYIAYFEGDDYWIDPLKLQKQVDFLEANDLYSACAHQFDLDKDNIIINNNNVRKEKDCNIENLLNAQSDFQTATFVFRSEIIKNSPLPSNFLSGDYYLFLLCSIKGPIKVLSDVMSVYRKHNGGVSSSVVFEKMKTDVNMIPALKMVWPYFPVNAFKAHLNYSIISNVKSLSTFQLIKYFCYVIYYSNQSMIDMTPLKISANKTLAYRLPRNMRRALRKLNIVKNYA